MSGGRRIALLGTAFVVYGAVVLVAAVIGVCACVGFAGALLARGDDPQMWMAAMFYLGAGALTGFLGAVLGVPCVVVGTGLRRRRPWARVGGLVCAALTLSHLPLGTVLAVVALATLLDPRAEEMLASPG